jgi:Fe-S cluster biosynthesis and repair protein YggX
MDVSQRIAQFEAMVRPEADPNNDMAWFSLAGAYAQAGRNTDAAKAYLRCAELNPDMSKAYQLAGAALIAEGDTKHAGEVLTKGFGVAAKRGDFMPRKAIGEMLEKLGLPVPQISVEAKAPAAAGGTFVCRRTGRPGTKMARPPFKGPVGAWIFENISQETFKDWIAQGTKVINEMRLDLSRDQDADTYDQHMREYLGIDEALLGELTKKS